MKSLGFLGDQWSITSNDLDFKIEDNFPNVT